MSGACEALFTPRPLGADLRHRTEPRRLRCRASDHERRAGALLRQPFSTNCGCSRRSRYSRMSTGRTRRRLDALKYLGRRIDPTPSLLVLTFRDDEVGANHPLRQLLGDLPSGTPDAPLARTAHDPGGRRARASCRAVAARPLRGDRWQPVLRHRSSGRQRRRHPGDGSRRRSCPCGSLERGRAPPARRGRSRPGVDRDRAPRGARRRGHAPPRRVPFLGDADAVGRRDRVPARARTARDRAVADAGSAHLVERGRVALARPASPPKFRIRARSPITPTLPETQTPCSASHPWRQGAPRRWVHTARLQSSTRARSATTLAADAMRLVAPRGLSRRRPRLTGRYTESIEARQQAISLARELDDRLRLGREPRAATGSRNLARDERPRRGGESRGRSRSSTSSRRAGSGPSRMRTARGFGC